MKGLLHDIKYILSRVFVVMLYIMLYYYTGFELMLVILLAQILYVLTDNHRELKATLKKQAKSDGL